MKILTKNRGQSTLEYAVVIALVIAALVFMGWGYFRGAYQKKIMSASDDISGGGQFDVRNTNVTTTQSTAVTSNESMQGTTTGASFGTTQNQTGNTSFFSQTADFTTRNANR